MSNPVLVEVTRGGIVESRHRASYAVSDADGQLLASAGDLSTLVFPRSAIKALQALAMVESGAAERFGFSDAEIALACASHNGEAEHIATARSMLAKIGITEAAYECGPHWPTRPEASYALARFGKEPGAVHNNCSGKHAGMLALAKHLGADLAGYTQPDHPVQQTIASLIGELTGTDLAAAPCGIDGCSVPTWALPLPAMALGFARFASGAGMSDDRKATAQRIISAVRQHPFMVAGTGRFCSEVMSAVPGIFVKTGAEGVFCAAIPEAGLGVALKCDDGATRAAEKLMARILASLRVFGDKDCTTLEQFAHDSIVNRAGLEVGELRALTS